MDVTNEYKNCMTTDANLIYVSKLLNCIKLQ